MGKLINRIPGSRLLISKLPGSALGMHVEALGKPCDVNKAFSKPCLINLISKDTHLVFSIKILVKSAATYMRVLNSVVMHIVITIVTLIVKKMIN